MTAQTPEALASEGAAQLALEVALGPKPYEVVADVLTEAHAIQEAELELIRSHQVSAWAAYSVTAWTARSWISRSRRATED